MGGSDPVACNPLCNGRVQSQVQFVHALGFFHQFPAWITQPGRKVLQSGLHALERTTGGPGQSQFALPELAQPVILVRGNFFGRG